MMTFKYFRPSSIKEACKLLDEYKDKAKIIAGGTDLLVQIRDKDKKIAGMQVVVDISALNEMNFIRKEGNLVHIGALTNHDNIHNSSLINELFSFLSEGCSTVGSPQIRHQGTIGGNICNASPAADAVPALVALDAKLRIESVDGMRLIEIADAFERPYVSKIAKNELLTEIIIEKLPENSKTSFHKLAKRKALAISRMNIAIAITVDQEGKVSDARIAPGCIFPTPVRVKKAEALLLGKVPTENLIHEASLAVSKEMIDRTGIRWSTEYKKPVIEAFTRRGIRKALGIE